MKQIDIVHQGKIIGKANIQGNGQIVMDVEDAFIRDMLSWNSINAMSIRPFGRSEFTDRRTW